MSSTTYVPFKRPGTKTKYSKKEAEDLARCIVDPVFFIESFVRVQHPIKGSSSFKTLFISAWNARHDSQQ